FSFEFEELKNVLTLMFIQNLPLLAEYTRLEKLSVRIFQDSVRKLSSESSEPHENNKIVANNSKTTASQQQGRIMMIVTTITNINPLNPIRLRFDAMIS